MLSFSWNAPPKFKQPFEYVVSVLRALNFTITTGITVRDITGVWAGLRPLVKSASSGRTADLSRRHKVKRSSSNVISVTGGKLTTYREMAQDEAREVEALDLAEATIGDVTDEDR